MPFYNILSSIKEHQEQKSKNIGWKCLLHSDTGILIETHGGKQHSPEWEIIQRLRTEEKKKKDK